MTGNAEIYELKSGEQNKIMFAKQSFIVSLTNFTSMPRWMEEVYFKITPGSSLGKSCLLPGFISSSPHNYSVVFHTHTHTHKLYQILHFKKLSNILFHLLWGSTTEKLTVYSWSPFSKETEAWGQRLQFLYISYVYVSHLVMSNSATPWTAAHKAPLSTESSRQES